MVHSRRQREVRPDHCGRRRGPCRPLNLFQHPEAPFCHDAGTTGGVVVNGCVAGLYSIAPTVYEPAVRTTGVGTGLAIGRAGGVGAAILAVLLFVRIPEQRPTT
jgi:hypothetical protein